MPFLLPFLPIDALVEVDVHFLLSLFAVLLSFSFFAHRCARRYSFASFSLAHMLVDALIDAPFASFSLVDALIDALSLPFSISIAPLAFARSGYRYGDDNDDDYETRPFDRKKSH